MRKFYFISYGKKLCGIIKERKDTPLVLIVHGWTSSKEGKTGKTLKSLGRKYAVMAFDFYGHGESQGRLGDMTISMGIRNVTDAAKYARKLGHKKIILVGSSFGCLCCMFAALKIKPLAMILRAPISYYFRETLDNKGPAFKKEYKKFNAYRVAREIKCPVIIFHSRRDERVPIDQSRKLAKLLKSCSLIELKHSGHNFTPNESELMLQETKNFLDKIKV